MMASFIITSYKKIIAKYMGVVKASLTHPDFSFQHDTTTTYKHTLRIFPRFPKFTLLTFTLFYILFNSIHDNCNTYNQKSEILPKTKKFGCVDRGDLTILFFSKVVK